MLNLADLPQCGSATQADVDAVVNILRRKTGVTLGSATQTVTVAGSWDAELPLPARPVCSVDSVLDEDGNTLADTLWYVSGGQLRRRSNRGRIPGYGFSVAGTRGANWGGPECFYTVTFTGGLASPLPPEIGSIVTKSLAARADSAAGNGGTKSSERLGMYSVSYRDDPATAGADANGLTDDDIATVCAYATVCK